MQLFQAHIFLIVMLVVSGPVQAMKAAGGFHFFDALDTAKVPKRLSESGLFADIRTKQPNDGVIPFTINTALWSDGAAKIRYIILPSDSQVTYRKDSSYSFPIGTVFAKNFLIDTIPGNANSRIYLETRLLVRIPDGQPEAYWYGFSYRWARDQSDAFLVDPQTGLDTVVPLAATTGGSPREMRWTYPSREACWRCHLQRGRHILGFATAELNLPASTGMGNQLETLANLGVFRDKPDLVGAHRWSSLSDTSASLEARARSYLAANCSFCHGTEGVGGGAGATQNFDYFRADFPINYLNRDAKFEWGIPGALFVYGGDPDRSILLYRMGNRADKRTQMPPLATVLPDSAALSVVAGWIRTLPAPSVAIRQQAGPFRTHLPHILAGELVLPVYVTLGIAPSLFSPRGQRFDLKAVGPGRYRLPTLDGPGIYLLRAGSEVFRIVWTAEPYSYLR